MINYITLARSGCQVTIWILLKYFSRNIYYPLTDNVSIPLHKWSELSLNRVLCYVNGTKIHNAGNMEYATFEDSENFSSGESSNFLHGHIIPYSETDNKYLIQHRHPLLALYSLGITPEDTYAGIEKWKKWVNMWIINNKNKNVNIVQYNELMEDPFGTLKNIINFLDLEEDFDADYLRKVLEYVPLNHRHTIDSYLPWAIQLAKEEEPKILPLLKELNIEPLWEHE